MLRQASRIQKRTKLATSIANHKHCRGNWCSSAREHRWACRASAADAQPAQAPAQRTSALRCSLVLGLPEGNLLIDTSPDLRMQLLREKIGVVHAVLYTHDHADHVFGLDDVRLFPHYLGHRAAGLLRRFCRSSHSQIVRLCVCQRQSWLRRRRAAARYAAHYPRAV